MKKLIEYLKTHRSVNNKVIEKHFLSDKVKDIMIKYSLTLQELRYRIDHNIPLNKVFRCKYCGKNTFKSAKHGYQIFCSNKCSLTYRNKSKKNKEKVKKTCLKKYGVHAYTLTREFESKATQTNKKRYGTENYALSQQWKERHDEILNKHKAAIKEHYGSEFYSQSQEFKDNHHLIERKKYNTKKKNNSFHTSKEEDKAYNLLLTKFLKDDIIRQYRSKLYPFACDFYIKSLDLYIEYNGTWTHGYYNSTFLGSFNKDNPEHIKILNIWKSKNTDFYRTAIYVWTILDPLKVKTAKENKLNYKVFWNLEEVEAWTKEI